MPRPEPCSVPVRLQVGNLDQKVEALSNKIDQNQAQIIELLTQLVGQRPDAD
ncbi:hypothetical protein [Streptomyces sp. 135]|uniref:hypothetical protein n=1 Tax=Streptomyces sp. 135 TaxID=2838850 RepID=UPI001CBB6F99|nr:hypothetical protein [Streptomyces sp. 135]